MQQQAARQDLQRQAGQPLGPLAGFAIVAKDSIDCAGLTTTGGTSVLAQHRASYDAPIMQRLRQAGALLLGKATMHELALGVSGMNYAANYPSVRNALDPRYVAGGSSGGSAVAVALGIADIALGTDTGGSIRIPAAFNGIVGLRPTQSPASQYGSCYSTKSCLPLAPTLDTVGPMARDVASLVDFDQRLQGVEPGSISQAATVRVGLPLSLWAHLDPQVESICKHACEQLRSHGIELIDVDIPDMLALARTLLFDLCMYEAAPALQSYLAQHGLQANVSLPDIAEGIAHPEVRAVFRDYILSDYSFQAWHQSRYQRQPLLRQRYLDCLKQWQLDALCFPAVAVLPPLWDEERHTGLTSQQDESMSSFLSISRNAALASATGVPALVLPAGYSQQGLAVGMELCGWPNEDRRLLQLGLLLERIWAS